MTEIITADHPLYTPGPDTWMADAFLTVDGNITVAAVTKGGVPRFTLDRAHAMELATTLLNLVRPRTADELARLWGAGAAPWR
jgi:hypothetical protein